MKKRLILAVIVLAALSTICSKAYTFIPPSPQLSERMRTQSDNYKYILNAHAINQYYLAAYGDPSQIPGNRFLVDSNGWMTRTNGSTERGEYQIIGHNSANVPITNDRWFSSPGRIGRVFNHSYGGVRWNNVYRVNNTTIDSFEVWSNINRNRRDIADYIVNAPFFDSDHPTRGETPTGFSLATLLPNGGWMNKSHILTFPTQFEDGAVFLNYTQNGRNDYNTIQIPALPRVDCIMKATANISAIERGKTSDVIVTIDTSESYALIFHEKLPEEITDRIYWAQTGAIAAGSAGVESESSVYRFTVPNVSPNTNIIVKATVGSERVREMGQPHTDSGTAVIRIGEIVPTVVAPDAPILGTNMDSASSVALKADVRGNEKFDVSKGIPSSEALYANVLTREYLIRQEYRQVTGSVSYTVSVSYPLPVSTSQATNSSPPGVELPPAQVQYGSTTVTVSRPYSYWEVARFEIFALDSATIESTVLPGGILSLSPKPPYSRPVIDLYHRIDDKFSYHLSPGSRSISTSSASSSHNAIFDAANAAVPQIIVRNDRLFVNGQAVLNDAPTSAHAPEPNPASPGMISSDVLFRAGLQIPESVTNGVWPVSGRIRYSRIESGSVAGSPSSSFASATTVNAGTESMVEQPILLSNSVVVHTPVILKAEVISSDAYNQSPKKDDSRASVVLGRPFTLRLSNTGMHIAEVGYGQRDYTDYVKDRYVRLSFDSYFGNLISGQYLQAGLWHSLEELGVDRTQSLLTFRVPVWVQPGNQSIDVRTTALNDAFNGIRAAAAAARPTSDRLPFKVETAPGEVSRIRSLSAIADLSASLTGRLYSGDAENTRRQDHAAVVTIPVTISGRIYDFKITDISDPMWETFFRREKGRLASSGKDFDTGNRNINAEPDPSRRYTLPVMPGKNDVTGFQNRAVKLGYEVKFEIKSIGPYYGLDDAIRMHPTFYYVDPNGKNRQEVDLYYSIPGRQLIKVGSASDNAVFKGEVNFAQRNLAQSDFTNTASTLWNLYEGNRGNAAGTDSAALNENKFIADFINNAQIGVDMFRTWRVLLGSTTRTFRGPVSVGSMQVPQAVDRFLAHASMQTWYGEWRLPPDTLIVPKGTDLSRIGRVTAQDPVFLKDGFLVVNFRSIELNANRDFDNPVLLYSGRDRNDAQASGSTPSSNLGDIPLQEFIDYTELGNGWTLEGYNIRQRVNLPQSQVNTQNASHAQNGWELKEGDAIFFYADQRSTDDVVGLGTH